MLYPSLRRASRPRAVSPRLALAAASRPAALLKRVGSALALAAVSLTVSPPIAQADSVWRPLHPGAGGQSQGVSTHVGVPDRMYFCSDVEGAYRSDDSGLTWTFIGRNISHGMTFIARGEPGNGDRVYVGSLYGLYISDDGGENFRYVNEVVDANGDGSALPRPTSITTIEVAPLNNNWVYVGTGWWNKNGQMSNQSSPSQSTTSTSHRIYYSRDRGQTWAESEYTTTATPQNYQVWSITPRGEDVVVAAEQGLFYGEWDGAGFEWQQVANPAGEFAGSSRGADLSPDGQWLYAVFNGVLHVTLADQLPQVAWQNVNFGNTANAIWRPRVDPRSSDQTGHRVLTGSLSTSDLTEGHFQPTGATMTVLGWNPILRSTVTVNTQISWNAFNGAKKGYDYTPADWAPAVGDRAVIATSEQQLYVGRAPFATSDWRSASSEPVAELGGIRMFHTRGIESTYNYDMTGYGNYVAQGMADNQLLESWDHGYSWTQQTRPNPMLFANADATHVVPLAEPTVLVGYAPGGGGGSPDTAAGTLYAKTLAIGEDGTVGFQPASAWRALPAFLPPQTRFWTINHDPKNPGTVYFGTRRGLYVTTDLEAYLAGTGGLPVSTGFPTDHAVGGIFVDPNDSNRIYLQAGAHGPRNSPNAESNSPIWKGVRDAGTGLWNFTQISAPVEVERPITNGTGGTSLHVWEHDGVTFIVYAAWQEQEKVSALKLSTDGGATFTTVFTSAEAIALSPQPWWQYNLPADREGSWRLDLSATAGIRNQVFVTTEIAAQQQKKGYALFRGEIAADGTVAWQDWSGEREDGSYLNFARSRRAKIWTTDGITRLYLATTGAGMWSRDINHPPHVEAAGPVEVDCAPPTGRAVALAVTVTDEDGGPLEVDWSVNGEELGATQLAGPGTATLSPVLPPGEYVIDVVALDNYGETAATSIQVTVQPDLTAPTVEVGRGVNPSGRGSPAANAGFVLLSAADNCDPAPVIYLLDASGVRIAGPFISGTTVKVTTARGTTSSSGGASAGAHVVHPGPLTAVAVDVSGNTSAPTPIPQ